MSNVRSTTTLNMNRSLENEQHSVRSADDCSICGMSGCNILNGVDSASLQSQGAGFGGTGADAGEDEARLRRDACMSGVSPQREYRRLHGSSLGCQTFVKIN